MKALVCSQLHLGGNAKNAELPAKIAAAASENGADALFVAGDLFCDHRFDDDIYNKLYNCFSALTGTHVFICPGPSDPYVFSSPYILRDWPENVHIFKNRMKAFEIAAKAGSGDPDIRVYGSGSARHRRGIGVINKDKLPKPDAGYLNILLLSAPPLDDEGNIDSALLEKCGFDAYVFGTESAQDASLFTGAENIVFVPGGADGVMAGQITKGGAPFEFAPVFPPEAGDACEQKKTDVAEIARKYMECALSGKEIPEVTGQ